MSWRDAAAMAGLALVVLLVYGQVAEHEFIHLDDQLYFENPRVLAGLTWEGLRYALVTGDGNFWHPMTWLSHMAAVEVLGEEPGGHLLINVVLHAVNVALLFAWWRQMGGGWWAGLWVSGLLAVHPVHVESVAWLTERKDVLSLFFGLLCLLAYTRYTRSGSGWSAAGWYAVCAVMLGLGLAAKSMLVTLPCAMVLLDVWPLKRLEGEAGSDAAGSAGAEDRRVWWRRGSWLLAEKLPLLGLSGAAAVATLATAGEGAMPWEVLGLWDRLAHAVVSYVRYLGMMLWPIGLLPIYPHPGHWPWWVVAGCGAVLAGITGLTLWQARRRPWLLVGWLWFLGTLFPVIGLTQNGGQAWAARFLYLPAIGLYLAAGWAAVEALRHAGESVRRGAATAGGVVLVLAAAVSFVQTERWENSVRLFGWTVQQMPANPMAHYCLGLALFERGDRTQALRHLERVTKLRPRSSKHRFGYAIRLQQAGLIDAALVEYRHWLATGRLKPPHALLTFADALAADEQPSEAVRLLRDHLPRLAGHPPLIRDGVERMLKWNGAEAALSLLRELEDGGVTATGWRDLRARAWVQLGELERAAIELEPSGERRPRDAMAMIELGERLMEQQEWAAARAWFNAAKQAAPDQAAGWLALGRLEERTGRLGEAVDAYRQAVEANPDHAVSRFALGKALADRGQLAGASEHLRAAVQLREDWAAAHNSLGVVLARQGRMRAAVTQFEAAFAADPDHPDARANLQRARRALGTANEAAEDAASTRHGTGDPASR